MNLTPKPRFASGALKRPRPEFAHPAEPIGDGHWARVCERDGCNVVFTTEARHRVYCSARCKDLVKAAARRRSDYEAGKLLTVCAGAHCDTLFVPARAWQLYCSATCRKRAGRAAGDLSNYVCAWCGCALDERRTKRARYCAARCRVAAARHEHLNDHTTNAGVATAASEAETNDIVVTSDTAAANGTIEREVTR